MLNCHVCIFLLSFSKKQGNLRSFLPWQRQNILPKKGFSYFVATKANGKINLFKIFSNSLTNIAFCPLLFLPFALSQPFIKCFPGNCVPVQV